MRRRVMKFLTAALPGTGGVCKSEPEDFRVDEVLSAPPTGSGAQLLIRIEKRGMSTHEAVGHLCRALGLPERDVGFAGIKDARAVATQWMSVPAGLEERLDRLDHPWLTIRERARHATKLRTGELSGNRFEIVLRGVGEDALARARAILAELARCGVPNWFGAQRFGTKGDGDRLGRALVREDGAEALALFLGRPSPREHDPRIKAARALFDEGKFEEAAEAYPGRLRAEAAVLRAWLAHRDPIRALARLPKRLRLLFLSAYQSHVFNRCLEARFGEGDSAFDRLRDGDVVLDHASGRTSVVDDAVKAQGRADRFEISAAGPIFGPGLLPARRDAARLERAIFDAEELDPEEGRQPFRDLHLRGERRAYRFPLRDAEVAAHEHGLVLRFFLPRGCYATNVVAEVTKGAPDSADATDVEHAAAG
jgi:tRNA pseudouridine13 synthase